MPICRLQKNHALTRRGGLPPLFRLIHPQPLMTQAKQNKERFIYRRSARSLVSLSFSLSLSRLSLFLPFLYRDGPRLFRAISFVLFARINSSLRFPSLTRTRRHLLVPPTPSHCLCLSLYPTYPPHLFHPLSLFLSFHDAARSLARSLTCAQMKSIKMLGATSRQSCSTPTPCFPFIPLALAPPPLPLLLPLPRPPPQPSPNSHSYAVRNRENPYVRSRYLPARARARASNFSTLMYHRRKTVWVGCKVRTCTYICVYQCAYVYICENSYAWLPRLPLAYYLRMPPMRYGTVHCTRCLAALWYHHWGN